MAGGGGCLTTFVWLLLLAPFAGDWLSESSLRQSGTLSQILTLRFASILTQTWAVLIAVALLLIGGLYVAVERQFQRMDLVASLRRLARQE
jgi:hypothetical protein